MQVSCGPLHFTFENGFIRHVTHGDTEILRMIYFALRDEDWETLPLERFEEETIVEPNLFRARYRAFNVRDGENVFQWDVHTECIEKGKITFAIEGTALKNFRRNRAGFCVLHPPRESAGNPVTIIHPDSSRTESVFPQLISADNPFMNIAGMIWKLNDKKFEIQFEGDIFETEDQRNWTDASYKTFCTPLNLPRPVELRKGEKVKQKVTFSPRVVLPSFPAGSLITIAPGKPTLLLPKIGLGYSPFDEIDDDCKALLRNLNLDHFRCEADLSRDDWEVKLRKQMTHAKQYAGSFELVIYCAKDLESHIPLFLSLLKNEKVNVFSLLLLSKNALTTEQEVIKVASGIKQVIPFVRVGAGTDYNFTEINRNRFSKGALDFISFSIHPQEHATDDTTIVENLEAQRHAVQSGRSIYQIPVHISPITLKRRFNPYTNNLNNQIVPIERQLDQRLHAPFGAVFTLGSIKNLCEAGAASVSYFKPTGPLGIIRKSGVVPVYLALAEVMKRKNSALAPGLSSAPLVADAMFFNDGHIMVWNYTSKSVDVALHDLNRSLSLLPYEFKVINRAAI